MQNEDYAIYQIDTVLTAKKWLEDRIGQTMSSSKKTHKNEVGSIEISKFLGEKNWSASKVKEYLRIANQLNPKILHEMKKNKKYFHYVNQTGFPHEMTRFKHKTGA